MKVSNKVALVPLRSCLVNLPRSLTRSLYNNDIAAQNAVATLSAKSKVVAHAGWTGHDSTDANSIEMDPAFARNIGVSEGDELTVDLVIRPREAEVVWVEPLSADDWEIMELHASFLELNLLNQIRAVSTKHPLTIYLNAHTTATIVVKKIEPELQDGQNFAKLSTSAEVVVSPKTRSNTKENSSAAKSINSSKSHVRVPEQKKPRNVFLRAIPDTTSEAKGMNVYLASSTLRSVLGLSKYLEIQVVLPPALRRKTQTADPITPPALPPRDNTTNAEIKVAQKVVVRAHPIEDISDKHVRLSPSVLKALEVEVGSRIRLSVATSPRKSSSLTCHAVLGQSRKKEIKIGGKKDTAVLDTFKSQLSQLGEGPITHGQRLPDFVVSLQGEGEWITIPPIDKISVTRGEDVVIVPPEKTHFKSQLPKGVEETTAKAQKVCGRYGGVLLYGSRGSGKSLIVSYCAQNLESRYDHVVSADCSKLSEERVSTIKVALNHWFTEAAWYEPAVVMIDDLDRLCPAEVEHADSTRARQVAEIFLSILKQFTSRHAIAILATAQSREALHSRLSTSHIFDETIHLKPPNKDARRQIAESLVDQVQGDSVDWLEVANMTDGYLAGDLSFLTERAKHEGLMREMNEVTDEERATLKTVDYEKAIQGFTPASLRGIKLQKSSVEWRDIGGLEETRRILLETLEWPTRYAPIFANCPLRLRSGLLLYGYPGCGKTLLASAVASECGLNFIAVKGPEILNKYIGASEKSVRDLFDRAQAAKPCVLFFDEFDSIAPKRGHDSTGVTDRVVNQMLTQMDGAEGLDGVYVLAATSRPDLIDPALLRPGRLDKSLLCNMPTHDDRRSILRALSRKMHLAADVDLDKLASGTAGFSGADLQAVLYNAHLDAIHDALSRQQQQEEEALSVSGHLDVDHIGTKQPTTFTKFRLADYDDKQKMTTTTNGAPPLLKTPMTLAELSAATARVESILVNASVMARHARGGEGGTRGGEGTKATPQQVIQIHWQNLQKSLDTTKPSISADERRRLDKVYHDFVDGRSADGLPDGQVAPGEQRATLA